MIITIYNKNDEYYKVDFNNDAGIYVQNDKGDGMAVNFEEFSDHLYKAIDKYFKEKF